MHTRGFNGFYHFSLSLCIAQNKVMLGNTCVQYMYRYNLIIICILLREQTKCVFRINFGKLEHNVNTHNNAFRIYVWNHNNINNNIPTI